MKSVIVKEVLKSNTIKEHKLLIFTSKELEVFDRFKRNLNNFKKLKIFENGLPYIQSINYNDLQGLKFVHSEYDDDYISALFLRARPFFLRTELASFEAVNVIFGKQIKEDESSPLRSYLKSIQNVYKKGLYQPYFQIELNGTKLFDDKTLEDWINAKEYHQFSEREKVISPIMKNLNEETSRIIFVSQMIGRIKAIFMLGELVDCVIDIGEIILQKI